MQWWGGLVIRILELVASVVLIVGGLYGQFVPRGTNSSLAVVVVGCGWLIWDIVRIRMHMKDSTLKEERQRRRNMSGCAKRADAFLQMAQRLDRPCRVTLQNASNRDLYIDNTQVKDLFLATRICHAEYVENLLQDVENPGWDFAFRAESWGDIIINVLSAAAAGVGNYFEIHSELPQRSN